MLGTAFFPLSLLLGFKRACDCLLLQGPFVQVDELMETFRRCTLPESKSAFMLNPYNYF